jgi:hypothetical protein
MDAWGNVPLNVHLLCWKGKNIILHWAFKLSSALAAAETWHLEGCTLKVNDAVSVSGYVVLNERVINE